MRLRTRLTLLYGGLFALASSVLLIVVEQLQLDVFNQVGDVPYVGPVSSPEALAPDDVRQRILRTQQEVADQQHHLTMIGIVVVTVLAFVVCWWLTGRLLRPLQRINGAARRLSISNLHERIALTGRPDELKELADTFDAMLDRLQEAVASQRRFVANASHELRTPLAIQRTAIEVGLDDPTPERLEQVRAEMLRNTERSERLIDGLLALAQGERGPRNPAPVDLRAVVEQVVDDHRRDGLRFVRELGPATVEGDEILLTRLVANLVENAIRYNRPGGTVTVGLTPTTFKIHNTGDFVRPERVPELFEPFRRLHPDRTGAAGPDRTDAAGGAGLGLSIVAAIAHAHGATVDATAGEEGGLTVTVAFSGRTGNRF